MVRSTIAKTAYYLTDVNRDIYRSSNIVIQDSIINNGDGTNFTNPLECSHINFSTDCVSFKPNVSDIVVQNLHCNGSHGISVGSLGQYVGEVDIVQNVLVYNISMFNASVSEMEPS